MKKKPMMSCHTLGKQSLSNVTACRSCPNANGCSIQLPNHQVLSLFTLPPFFYPQFMTLSSDMFQLNSRARKMVRRAMETRRCLAG